MVYILPEDTVLYRSIEGNDADFITIIGDNGFMSKTFSFDVAKDFSSRKCCVLFFP